MRTVQHTFWTKQLSMSVGRSFHPQNLAILLLVRGREGYCLKAEEVVHACITERNSYVIHMDIDFNPNIHNNAELLYSRLQLNEHSFRRGAQLC